MKGQQKDESWCNRMQEQDDLLMKAAEALQAMGSLLDLAWEDPKTFSQESIAWWEIKGEPLLEELRD